MSRTTLAGRTALVTGASSGIGADLARELAARGANLVLAARRGDALENLAQEIRAREGVQVLVAPADLADPAERLRLAAELEAGAVQVDLLVNNAGFGLFGAFADMEWDRVDGMIQLDITALTHLTHLFVGGMRARGWGRILLLGSTGAFQPTPTYAVYCAAKAYVLSFGVALNQELRGSGVSCTTLCPGVTRTGFHDVAGQAYGPFHRMTVMTSERVAQIGVRALLARRASVVAGTVNAVVAASTRLMPRSLSAATASAAMKM
jgi:short-subunit dehydrogenase